jgi:hypothetical protein
MMHFDALKRANFIVKREYFKFIFNDNFNHFLFLVSGSCLESLDQFENAIEVYRMGNFWNESLNVIRERKNALPEKLVRRTVTLGIRYYAKRGDKKNQLECVKSLQSFDEKVRIFRNENLFKELAEFLIAEKKHVDAADVYLKDLNDEIRAAECFTTGLMPCTFYFYVFE